VGERSFSIGASIGVVPITAASGRTADVLRAADDACYTAKDAGGSRVSLGAEAVPGVQQQLETRRITRLTRAVEEWSFHLFAQAIVPLAPRQAARPRCEILLRLPDGHGAWRSRRVPPLADRHRLLPEIDRWVVRRTVALLADWHRITRIASCPSARSTSAFPHWTTRSGRCGPGVLGAGPSSAPGPVLRDRRSGGSRNFSQLVRLISEMRRWAAESGWTTSQRADSFTHLKALPVDYVKIGGHYVRGVVNDPVYGALVSAVNQIGRIMVSPRSRRR